MGLGPHASRPVSIVCSAGRNSGIFILSRKHQREPAKADWKLRALIAAFGLGMMGLASYGLSHGVIAWSSFNTRRPYLNLIDYFLPRIRTFITPGSCAKAIAVEASSNGNVRVISGRGSILRERNSAMALLKGPQRDPTRLSSFTTIGHVS